MAPDFTTLPDLACERLGGAVVFANDDFFAPKENLVRALPPVWIEGKYTDDGKWMDGWETRRRRTPGHDLCIVRLGLAGLVRGVVVDTSHFRGNFPEACSIDAVAFAGSPPAEELSSPGVRWTELLPRSPLSGDAKNLFPIDVPWRFTHLRLNIYPDGGVARLRVHGEVVPDLRSLGDGEIDLAAAENGGRVDSCSDRFFGAPENMIAPGRAPDMSDGWESRRRRGPGHDWTVLRLGVAGTIRRIEVDTSHFKGNFPESCSLEAARGGGWEEVLPRASLQAHTRHQFCSEVRPIGPVDTVRLNIFPDGGVSRLRLYGRADEAALRAANLRRLGSLPPPRAEEELLRCCGSRAWASRMTEHRPFSSREALIDAAETIWRSLSPHDWREAFAAHPRIGDRQALAGTKTESREQAGVAGAPAETLARLADGNRAYEARFGHVFLICATGRTAADMLASLETRLKNDAETELVTAAEEQRKITELRLGSLLGI